MIDRRQFLRKSILSLAGVASVPLPLLAAAASAGAVVGQDLTLEMLEDSYLAGLNHIGKQQTYYLYRGRQSRKFEGYPSPQQLMAAWLDMGGTMMPPPYPIKVVE